MSQHHQPMKHQYQIKYLEYQVRRDMYQVKHKKTPLDNVRIYKPVIITKKDVYEVTED